MLSNAPSPGNGPTDSPGVYPHPGWEVGYGPPQRTKTPSSLWEDRRAIHRIPSHPVEKKRLEKLQLPVQGCVKQDYHLPGALNGRKKFSHGKSKPQTVPLACKHSKLAL